MEIESLYTVHCVIAIQVSVLWVAILEEEVVTEEDASQPCRMEYDVLKDGKVLNPGNNKYVLSPKDICTLKILPESLNQVYTP